MNIYGLNIASSTGNPNGRGWIDPETREFVYLPIEEVGALAQRAPTFRELGFPQVKYPHLPVHLDPEFKTFTYGHVTRGFGDAALWHLGKGDLLFFYASLNLLPNCTEWGLYIIGCFQVLQVCDTRRMTSAQIKQLKGFESNAHMKRRDPSVHLLVKGSSASRKYDHAILLSHPQDPHRLHPSFAGRLTTVSGKPLRGNTWHRWVFYSQDGRFGTILRSHQ